MVDGVHNNGIQTQIVDTSEIDQNGLSEEAKQNFAELVKQTIDDQLVRQGITPPQGADGGAALSPEAEQKLEEGLASGDLSGFIEQMVKEALEEAGVDPGSLAQGESGGGVGSPEAMTEQIMEALQQSGGASGGDLGQMIGDEIDKMVLDALETVGITPDGAQGSSQQASGNIPPNNSVQTDDGGGQADASDLFESDRFNDDAANFLNNNNAYAEADQVIDPENTIFRGNNGLDIDTPEVDLSETDDDGSQSDQSISYSTSESINGVNTDSNTQFSSNGGNGNVTSQNNDDEISNAA